MDLSHRDRVNSLAAKIRALPGYPSFPGVEAGRARYDHMGALLADAALQAAIDFNSVVKPRVQRLLAAWPEADTVARFLVRVRAEGLNQVLGWADAEKPLEPSASPTSSPTRASTPSTNSESGPFSQAAGPSC